MISRRTTLRLGLLLGASGLLAACGAPPAPTAAPSTASTKPPEKPAEKPAAAPAATTAPPAAAAKPSGGAPSTLTWLVRSDVRENPWEEKVAIPSFAKANPSVTVNLVNAGSANWNAKVMSMYAGGTPPDVHNGIVGTFIQLYSQDKVKELSPYIASDKVDLAPFGKLAKDPDMCRNGKQWCLPILTTLAQPIFYNIDLFQKASLPLPPTDPADKSWNLDKIAELAGKLTKNWGTADATYGIATPNQFHIWAYLWGVDPWTKDWYEHGIGQKSNYLDPKVAEAQQFRADLINKLKVSPRPSDEQGMAQIGDIFKTGRVAMYWAGGNGYWLYSDITAFKWGVAPGPWRDTHKAVNFTDPVLVSGDSKIADTAWTFVKYLTSKEGQTEYVQATGTPPVRLDVFDIWLDYELPKTGMKSKEDLKKVALYYENSYIDNWAHYTINAAQFQTIQTQDGQPIWDGQVPAKDQMPKIQKDMDDALVKTYEEYKGTRLTSDVLCAPIQTASLAPDATCLLTEV